MRCPNCGTENPPGAFACGQCGMQFQVTEPSAQQTAPAGVEVVQRGGYETAAAHYGGFWVRFLAVIVDSLVLGVVLGVLVGGAALMKSTSLIVAGSVVTALIVYGYNILMIWKFQATLGKMTMGLKVFREDGTPPGFGTSALREISKFLSALFCYIGFIWVGFDDYKQAWHDKIAKTYVVYTSVSGPSVKEGTMSGAASSGSTWK